MKMGRFSRSWALVKQSFAILRSDKQLMLFPILTAVSCLIVTALVVGGGVIALIPSFQAARLAGEHWQPGHAPMFFVSIFALYVVNYFVIVFFNVALVGVANSRLLGGKWTLRDGISLAWERKFTILQWAIVAATVGMILRTLEERMGVLGRIIMKIIGVAWALACYFVVPVLAFEDLGPVDAVKRSAHLFRTTWGEKVVGGFSIGLIFMLLALPGFGIWIAAMALGGVYGMLGGLAFLILYFVVLSVISSACQGIFNTALYPYPCFNQVPPAFEAQLITSAWAPKQ